MLTVFPDYYKEFKCSGGACKHNCCIGWDIDVDADALAFYNSISGEMGARLRENISSGSEPHFILGKDERCPFLNRQNLCDIILHLGEEHLCSICTDHPRFRNELPGRIETGLGLCCEEAARLILGKETRTKLESSGDVEGEDEILALRDKAIAILQDRAKTIPQRMDDMLSLCSATLPEKNFGEWAEILLDLERLDNAWTRMLMLLRNEWQTADFSGFDLHMFTRQTEYEQLLVYFVYRHFANAPDLVEAAARAAFAALGYTILHALGALLWTKNKTFTLADQIELARLFSSEIEYSDENLYLLLAMFTKI